MEITTVEKTAEPAGTSTATVVVPAQTAATIPPVLSANSSQQAGGVKSMPTFAHIELMEKNKLTTEKLSTELRMKINAWAMGVRKYDKNPTPKLLEMNKKGSIAIADAIQNWIEKDLPEKSEAEIKAEQEAKSRAEQEKAKADRIKAESERRERELRMRRDTPPRPVQKTNEQKVAEILKEKGKIHYKELVEILGQGVGEMVQVGSIKLMNIYFTNNYKQVK